MAAKHRATQQEFELEYLDNIWSRAALLLTGSVMAARFLTTENPRGWTGSLSAWAYAEPGPGPVTTLIFAGLLLLAFCFWLTGAVRSGRMARWPVWLVLGVLALSLCTIIAATLASERRIAAHLAADWITQWLTLLMLLDLLRNRGYRKILLTAVLATATLVSVKCIYQAHIELPEMLANYRQEPGKMLYGIGVVPGTAQAAQFEERIRQGQATGYFALGNVTASGLILAVMATIGLVADRIFTIRQKFSRLLGLLLLGLAVVMVYAIVLTGSRGAMAGLGLAAVLFASYLGVRRIAWRIFRVLQFGRYYRTIALVIVALVLVAVLAVVGFGLKYDSLGVKSLTYRWHYWVGSARMFYDFPWFGVGPGNFKFHYPAYKLTQAVEEVANPHNPIVQMFTETGLFGGLSLIALLAGIFVVTTCPTIHSPAVDAAGLKDRLRVRPLLWLVLLALGAFALRTAVNTEGPALLRLLSAAANPEDVPVLILGLIAPLAVWIIAFLIVVCDSDDLSGNNLPVTPLVRIAIICGLVGFVLNDQITSALLDSGGGTVFWVFAALAVVMHPSKAKEYYNLSRIDRYLVLILVAMGVMGFVGTIFVPAAREQLHLKQALQDYRNGRSADIIEAESDRAAQMLPSDPWPHAFAARVLAEQRFFDQALAQQRRAVDKNPYDWTAHFDLARLLAEQANRSASKKKWASTIQAMHRALECYPTSPVLHEYLADLFAKQQDWANAAWYYKQALGFNEAKKLDPNYQWPREHRRQVEDKLRIAQEHLARGQQP